MTQQEFIERTKIKDESTFKYANDLYMAIPTLDKDAFCADFSMHKKSRIVEELFKVQQDYEVLYHESRRQIGEAVDMLLGKACAYDDIDFYKLAVRLIGQKQVTLRKIEMGLPLWEEDKNYLIMNLK